MIEQVPHVWTSTDFFVVMLTLVFYPVVGGLAISGFIRFVGNRWL